MGRACGTHAETSACRGLVKRPLGRRRHRWEDNITMDLAGVGCEDAEWIRVAQGRDRWRAVLKMVLNLRVA
jgi:hypothetical protein